jgi:hypothetical protein
MSDDVDLFAPIERAALVITDNDGTPLWAAGVSGHGNYARLQEAGNLLIRDADGDALWASGTSGNLGATLVLQEDGNVVIKSGSTVVWEADTAH